MEKLNFSFQTDSEIVKSAYSLQANYLIEHSNTTGSTEKYCILYFSSHDIYYPNNENSFKTQILEKNKFEWYNTRIIKGEKHIFIRDIKKQWYLTGINSQINSIEKLYEFLHAETLGYKTISIGSSAGGYAAVLFGSMLNSETVLTFNGQFMLSDLLGSSPKKYSSETIDPIVFREKDNPAINKYYSLIPHIRNPKRIYYFFSNQSDWDLVQYNHISNSGLQLVPFRSNHHGIPFLKTSLSRVVNMPVVKMQQFVGKTNSPVIFSIKINGLIKTIMDSTIAASKYVSKKIKKRF